MSVVNNTLLLTGGEYEISRSVRLRSSASAYFNRTFGSPTSGNIFTWSGWVKRGAIGSVLPIFTPSLASGEGASFNASNQLVIAVNGAFLLVSTPVYRDPSAWYHIMLVSDMGNATASLRFRVYVNGVEVTTWSTDARASYTSFPYWNKNTVAHYIGYSNAYPAYGDGYLTEINFVDGQALTPSSFGETDAITGVWKPKKYGGTYGTNGFYLNFSDNSAATAAAIGKDNSGNGNNWTPNNISVTAGSTYDSMIDVPTPYADGGNGRGNYSVVSTLDIDRANITTSNGNLTNVKATTSDSPRVVSSMGATSGKWYAEVTWSSITDSAPNGNYIITGVTTKENWTPSSNGFNAVLYFASNSAGGLNGQKATWSAGSYSGASAYGSGYWVAGSVVGIALDLDAGTVTFYNNGVSQGAITLPTTAQEWFVYCTSDGTNNGYTNHFNFGQRPFAYTPPTGFKALNTQNLPEPTIKKGNQHFDATTYTGNGTSQSIVNGAAMQPDLVWIKARSSISNNILMDSVRGASVQLSSDQTAAEGGATGLFTGFNANGFGVTGNSSASNQSSVSFVGWQWKAAGSTVTNTDGSITSTVSANPTAGFSIVTYTGTGSNATVGHGLGVAPKMIIAKSRSSGASGWPVYHSSTGAANYLALNTTAASAAGSVWNSTAPTSSVFSVGPAANGINDNGATYVAYCFAEVAGFSRFGSYTGNGSADGPFVFVNHRPAFVMIKRTDTTSNWTILDFAREGYNVDNDPLYPNLSNAEGTTDLADLLSNGFKLRSTDASVNASGGTYIYMAVASNPFKYSLGR